MAILITGSSGTMGTRLFEKLLEMGYDAHGVDIRPNKWLKKANKLTTILDLSKKGISDKITGEFGTVIHLAANARVYNLVVEPSKARDNFEMLFNILEFCRRKDIGKFIFASSREVYGNSEDKIVHSEDESYVRKCESPYTASKIGGEALVHAYSQCYGMDFVILRFSNVYGMYDESDRAVPLFIRLSKKDNDLVIYGKDKIFDFTYIDDAVSGLLKSLKNTNKAKNQVFNIATGKGVSLINVAEEILNQMGSKSRIIIKENRPGEIVRFVADISKAKKELGYEPKVDIKEGLHRSISWFQTKDRSTI